MARHHIGKASMPGMMPPTMLPGHGMGHGMERELGPQMHRSQSMPPGSYPPAAARRSPLVHTGGRFDRDDAPRNAPPLLGWKTGRNDPTLMNNEAVKMRLGRDRSEMEPRQAAQFINHVQQQGRAAERLAEEQCRAELARNNMGNIDEIVFGRDMDGSGGAAEPPGEKERRAYLVPGQRRSEPDRWNRNFRSEAAEINFGGAVPSTDQISDELGVSSDELGAPMVSRKSSGHLNSLTRHGTSTSLHHGCCEMPPTMRPMADYTPSSSLVGGLVFNAGDHTRARGRLPDDERYGLQDRETAGQLNAAIIGGVGSRAYESGLAERQLQRDRGRGSSSMAGMFDPDHCFGKASSGDKLDARGRQKREGQKFDGSAEVPASPELSPRKKALMDEQRPSQWRPRRGSTTFEFRGPDNPPEWTNQRVPPGQERSFGNARQGTVDLSDRGPVDIDGRILPAPVQWSTRGGVNAGGQRTYDVATEPLIQVPGKYLNVHGSLQQRCGGSSRHHNVNGEPAAVGKATIERDFKWDPDGNAAVKSEAHASNWRRDPKHHRACALTVSPRASLSNVDDVVYGRDKDNSGYPPWPTAVTLRGQRRATSELRLRTVDGEINQTRRQVEHPAMVEHPATVELRWDDTRSPRDRPASELERRAAVENMRRIKGGNRAPDPLLMGPLERKEGAAFIPSAAAPPRSQMLDSEVARLIFHSDEDGVRRPPSQGTAFSQASGLGLPKRQLAPERLLLARTAGFADSRGRAKATSVVDEVVFGKTGADGFIHDQCLQANFTVNREGDYVKGHQGR